MANPGKLNRRLTLQARMATRDEAGARVESWVDTAQIWAELVDSRQFESTNSDAERLNESATWRIRWRDVSAGNNRIVYRDQVYGIDGVVEEGIKNTLRLACRALKGLEV